MGHPALYRAGRRVRAELPKSNQELVNWLWGRGNIGEITGVLVMPTIENNFIFNFKGKRTPFCKTFHRTESRPCVSSTTSHHRPRAPNHCKKHQEKPLHFYYKVFKHHLTKQTVCFFNRFMLSGKTQIQLKILLFKVIFITFLPSGSRASIMGKSDRK